VNDVVVIAPRTAEVVADSPDRRVEILADHELLNATWSRFGPRREGADLHVHRHHTDVFYVLDGELTLRIGLDDEQLTVPAGSLVCVPPLVVHGFRNAAEREVTYVNLHAPGMRFADYMRGLRDGREFVYDQHEPSAEGSLPTRAITVSSGEGQLADADDVAVSRVRLGAGEEMPVESGTAARFLYVLNGGLGTAGAGSWLQLRCGAAGSAGAAGADLLEVRVPG
jgi:mannose-6-phosphate isomerase-like protein (cupin superfamily)